MIIEIILAVLFPTLWFIALELKFENLFYSFIGFFSFIVLSIFYLLLATPNTIFVRVFCEEFVKCIFTRNWKEGASSGIGFSIIENLLWALQSNPMNLVLRGVFTTGIHAVASGSIATRKPSLVIIGYLFHVNWNLLVRSL